MRLVGDRREAVGRALLPPRPVVPGDELGIGGGVAVVIPEDAGGQHVVGQPWAEQVAVADAERSARSQRVGGTAGVGVLGDIEPGASVLVEESGRTAVFGVDRSEQTLGED